MKTNPNVFANCTLNALRKVHLPTYVAARYLFDSMAGEAESSWSIETTLRKYPLRRTGAFRSVQKFKKVNNADGAIDYREFMVPSPTTSLAEAVVLRALSAQSAFAKSNSVYSYLWPTESTHPANFSHYSDGYKKRNEDIEARLRENPNFVALVSDIEKFYPSIDQAVLKARFEDALRQTSLSVELADTARKLIEHICLPTISQKGIGTGPEISHVAGDLALREVDAAFDSEFRGGYFRYVDDIVVLVERDNLQRAKGRLADLLEREELTVHDEKTDWVTSEEWLAHGPHNHSRIQENSFEALLFQLKVFLLLHPTRLKDLDRALESEGISIPLDRLLAISRGRQFSPKFWSLWMRRWHVAVRAWNSTDRELVSSALFVRNSLQTELNAHLEKKPPISATKRRWYIQRLRYLVNRSFYLFDDRQLQHLISPLSSLPEFAEAVALLKTLVLDDASWLLNMPGAAVSVAGERLSRRGAKVSGLERYGFKNPATIESLAGLGLFGVVDVPATLINSLDENDREFLLFSTGIPQAVRAGNDFGYEDEIRCLQLGRTSADSRDAIETRFSDDETSIFDGLYVGSAQSS